MSWSVEDAARFLTHHQLSLRQRRPLQAVALGGLVIASMCIALLYLAAFRPITLTDEGLILTPPISAAPAVMGDITVEGDEWEDTTTDGSTDGAIMLHPEQHIYRKPKTILLGWNITKERRSPDGVVKPVYLINGSSTFPSHVFAYYPQFSERLATY